MPDQRQDDSAADEGEWSAPAPWAPPREGASAGPADVRWEDTATGARPGPATGGQEAAPQGMPWGPPPGGSGPWGPPAGTWTAPYGPPTRPAGGPAGTGGGNPLAVAGFVVGLLGLLLAAIPVVGLLGWPMVLIGGVLSVIGIARAGREGLRGLAVAGAALSALGLVVCIVYSVSYAGTIGRIVAADEPVSSPYSPSYPSPSSREPATPAPSTLGGPPVVFDDGVAVTVAPPRPFVPSRSASGEEGAAVFFVVQVTVTNGTPAPMQASSFRSEAAVGGRECSRIFDSEVGSAPSLTLLPGRSITFDQAYGTSVPTGELQVDVKGGYSRPAATFTGRL